MNMKLPAMKAATTYSRGAVPGRPRGSIDPSLAPATSRGPLEPVSGIPLNHAGCPSTFITAGLLICYKHAKESNYAL